MVAVYSFVVDGGTAFPRQARLLLATMRRAQIAPAQIHAQLTPSVSIELRAELAEAGIGIHDIEPFLDGKYCNKLVQLDSLIELDADYFVLCDTDLAFTGPIDRWFDPQHIRAKPVDLANPPLDRLQELKARLGVGGTPRLVSTSCGDGLTWSVNCNGGLYIIPRHFAAPLAWRWKRFAAQLRQCEDVLETWYVHVDQIAFALSMLDMDHDLRELPITANFPMHLHEQFLGTPLDDPVVLHYHWLQAETGELLTTGNPTIDRAVEQVNRIFRTPSMQRPKIIAATGWWCSNSDSEWRIGTPAAKTAAFFDLWFRQVTDCLAPDRILVTDSASPIKPDLTGKDNVAMITLDRNYGHANDIRVGRIATQFSGFTRSVLMGAMYALACDADYFVYIEQDCLLFGGDFLKAALASSDEDILLGQPTDGGRGLDGATAAPMLQQSLIIVRRAALPRFIDGIAAAPWTDGELSPEEIMRRRLPPFGLLAVPYGRSRPIDFAAPHFYVQHLTEEELQSAMALSVANVGTGDPR